MKFILLGAGLLNIPYAFSESGIGPATIAQFVSSYDTFMMIRFEPFFAGTCCFGHHFLVDSKWLLTSVQFGFFTRHRVILLWPLLE